MAVGPPKPTSCSADQLNGHGRTLDCTNRYPNMETQHATQENSECEIPLFECKPINHMGKTPQATTKASGRKQASLRCGALPEWLGYIEDLGPKT